MGDRVVQFPVMDIYFVM